MKKCIKITIVMSLLIMSLLCSALFACSEPENIESGLTLTQTQITMEEFDTVRVRAQLDGDYVTDAVWTSSDQAICTVVDGKIEALKVGSATIKAEKGEKSATCTVTVTECSDIPAVELSQKVVETKVGEEITITATASIKGKAITPEFSYTSNDKSIATFENGVIKGIAKGETTVTVIAKYGSKIGSADVSVTIKEDVSVVLGFGSVTLKSDKVYDAQQTEKQIEYKILKDGKEVTNAQITYEVENSEICSVSETGLITAIKDGVTTVKMTINGVSSQTIIESISVEVERSHKIVEVADYEVVKGIESETIKYNSLKVDGTGYDEQSASVKVYKYNESIADYEVIKETNANKVSNEYVIDGAELGASVYGEVKVVLTLENIDIEVPTTIITKKITSVDDLNNMSLYGGAHSKQEENGFLGTDADGNPKKETVWLYDGYFVLENNIDFENQPFMAGRAGYTQSTTTLLSNRGFKGVFDGKGNAIENVTSDNGGVFGLVHKDGVVKNLAVTGTISTVDSGLLGKQFSGWLDNSYIQTKVGSLKATASVATIMSFSHVSNVVIVADASSALRSDEFTEDNMLVTHGYVAGYLGHITGTKDGPAFSQWTTASVSNVMAFVKNPDAPELELPKATSRWSQLLPASIVNAISLFGYDQNVESETALNGDYWEFRNGRPCFKSVVYFEEIEIAEQFEVYSSIKDNQPKANKLTVDLGGKGVTQVKEVYVGTTKATDEQFSFSNGVLSIDGSAFGATNYGAVTVNVLTDKVKVLIYVNVVTKKISSVEDLQSFAIYGGILNDATNYIYNGYFILTNNIECDPNTPYVRAQGISYAKKNVTNNWDNTTNFGFEGIFDGMGYTIKNIYISSQSNFGTGGIFGNVGRNGIVKNLGIKATLECAGRVETLGYTFYGTLQNCYFDVTAKQTATGEYYTVAQKMPLSKIKDVVIKADFSKATKQGNEDPKNAGSYLSASAFFGQALIYSPSGGQYKSATFTNVHGFVKEPENLNVVLYTEYYGNQLWESSTKYVPEDNVTKYAYDAKIETEITFSDGTYWTANSNGQPTFKTAK